MTSEERLMALLKATPEMKRMIDAILCGKDPCGQKESKTVNTKLLTITECCSRLGMNYQKFRRLMLDGFFTPVATTGRTMIREEEVIEFSMGLRKPSAEALARHEERNAARRMEYKARKEAILGDKDAAKVAAALGWK